VTAPTTKPRAWDYRSGVSECDTCGGAGSYVKFPRGAYRLNPLEWTETCTDCDGSGETPCDVCGFDQQIAGYDCFACELVGSLTRKDAGQIVAKDLIEAITHALIARLESGQ
jgi:DnaJ-class molecular chaperone